MRIDDFERFNAAAKRIEADACEGYFSTTSRYGSEVAGAMLTLYLRLQLNPEQRWPAPDDIETKIAEVLKEYGILEPAVVEPV